MVGEYTGVTVPYVGYAMSFAVSKAGSVVLMIIPGLLLLLYALYSSWKAVAALERRMPRHPQPAAAGRIL